MQTLDINSVNLLTQNKYIKNIFNYFHEKGVDIIIAGSSLLSILNDTPVHDFDIFFKSQSDVDYILNNIDKNDIVFKGVNGTKIKIIINNKIYLLDLVYNIIFKDKVLLVNHFDFTINQIAIDALGLYYSEYFVNDYTSKTLRINKLSNPGSTLKRLIKYTKKEYVINNLELKKLYKEIQDTDKEFPLSDNISQISDNISQIDKKDIKSYLLDIFKFKKT
jgi:hypothetical protein